MPHETFAKIKGWQTLDLVMLRNLLHREIHRRIECVIIGKGHTEEEIKAYDEKAEAAQARERGDIRSDSMAMAPARQSASETAQEPKEGP